MKQLKQWFANQVATFFKNPNVRYKFVLPLADIIAKDADEVILEKAMKYVGHSGIKGDYLEFGVWKGRSFSKAYHMSRYVKSSSLAKMQFYAFDSFQGLPEITNVTDKTTGEFKRGDYSCDLPTFKRILQDNGVEMSRVVTVPGWYGEVLNEKTKQKLELKSAAIIFVDCDLYESAVDVLNFVTDYVVDGTVIIFDDWFCFRGDPDRGEQRAFREWLARNHHVTATEWQTVSWKSKAFLLNKKF